MENLSLEDIEQNYISLKITAEQLLNYTSGNWFGIPISQRTDVVTNAVKHIELMLSKEYWTDEDMTEVHAAIAVGKTYLNQL